MGFDRDVFLPMRGVVVSTVCADVTYFTHNFKASFNVNPLDYFLVISIV